MFLAVRLAGELGHGCISSLAVIHQSLDNLWASLWSLQIDQLDRRVVLMTLVPFQPSRPDISERRCNGRENPPKRTEKNAPEQDARLTNPNRTVLDDKPEDRAHRLQYGLQNQPPDGLEDGPDRLAEVAQNPTQACEKDPYGIEGGREGAPNGKCYNCEDLHALRDTEDARSKIDDATKRALLGHISQDLRPGSGVLTP